MLRINTDSSIELTRGDTAYLEVGVHNDTTNEKYQLQEGDVLMLTVSKYEGAEPLFTKTTVDGIFKLNPVDTKSLNFRRYVYDVQLTTSLGEVFTVVPPSDFKVCGEVTL